MPNAGLNDGEPILWPARNIAEYAYCPRLFYLMEVEGLFVPSADTEMGKAVHERVDQPSAEANDRSDTDAPRSVRSLVLSSPGLALTATLDLAEIQGTVAVPVEYRKGRPRRRAPERPESAPEDAIIPPTAPEPWPTDRIQVGLQAILLEESGYQVPRAVLYYAAERHRLEIPVDYKLKNDALFVLDAAKGCSQGARPLPLVNDERCLGCSLQPLCLPDEINLQRDTSLSGQQPRRKLWPPRDDGIHVVAQAQATKIGVSGLSLIFKNKDGIIVKKSPLVNVESLSLLGAVQVSTQAMHTLADRGIPVAFLSAAGRLVAMVDPLDSVSAHVRTAQVRRFDDPQTCLEISRALISSKITNQRTLLMRNHASLPNDVAITLATEAERASTAATLDEVRGHEGQAAAVYFAHFAGMFSGPVATEFDSNGRQRRPPPDPINSCISLAYSMLVHECVAALRHARLEPSIGAFHVSRPGRPALALDLMEPFRPLIADSVAVSAFNRNELGEGHFLRTAAGCSLTEAGRRAFFSLYGRRMDTEITHPAFKYCLSYRRMIILHARMVAAWLLDEIPTLSFLTTR